jgi:hypothetical protein
VIVVAPEGVEPVFAQIGGGEEIRIMICDTELGCSLPLILESAE